MSLIQKILIKENSKWYYLDKYIKSSFPLEQYESLVVRVFLYRALNH